MMAETVFSGKGIADLKRAIDKVQELQEYEELLLKNFTEGKKPPLKFSDEERGAMIRLINKVENRKKRKPNRSMTFVVSPQAVDDFLAKLKGKGKDAKGPTREDSAQGKNRDLSDPPGFTSTAFKESSKNINESPK